MATNIAALLSEARDLVEQAIRLVVEADETLAAAELEQALHTIHDRAAAAGRLSSGSTRGCPSALQ
ncbi:uncharacterized protein YbaP (TraB family) [Sphingomonas insulae]|uniref:Uncharacterized protein n=1 Tax=Sphingomonas insulae TaxID=424800 RepID=A0ABN1HW77_9SPHN|nr:hypothetical protein [Sphingomonas insulae]NIJ28695.1 uncharacterized protein YbaP (TraB family) [Sphingomonas insulae]